MITVWLSNIQNGTGLPSHQKLHSVNVCATAPGPAPKFGFHHDVIMMIVSCADVATCSHNDNNP